MGYYNYNIVLFNFFFLIINNNVILEYQYGEVHKQTLIAVQLLNQRFKILTPKFVCEVEVFQVIIYSVLLMQLLVRIDGNASKPRLMIFNENEIFRAYNSYTILYKVSMANIKIRMQSQQK